MEPLLISQQSLYVFWHNLQHSFERLSFRNEKSKDCLYISVAIGDLFQIRVTLSDFSTKEFRWYKHVVGVIVENIVLFLFTQLIQTLITLAFHLSSIQCIF